MAIKLGWGGFVTTDLNFSEFIGAEHTIAFRFMPQYPNAYAGAVLSSVGSPFYFVGQGQFQAPPARKPSFITQVGDERQDYPIELSGNVWHYVAVVRKATKFRTYFDTQELKPRINIPTHLPKGKVVIGRFDIWQFYGLIDDLVVFNRALDEDEILKLTINPIPKSSATSLRAAWNFPTSVSPGLPAKFRRPIKLNGAAELVGVSSNQSSLDSKLFGPPSLQFTPHLPFPTGEIWSVGQGFDDRNGSHWGPAAFCLDLNRVDGATRGSPLYAVAPGKVLDVVESSPSGPLPKGVSGNYVYVEHAPGENSLYAHILQNSAAVSIGDEVVTGQHLGATGDTGAPGTGNDHLHFDTSFVFAHTIPSAFKDYEASTDGGKTWRHVSWGTPKKGELIRSLPKWSQWFGLGGGIEDEVTVIRPEVETLDIYARGIDSRLYQKWWTGQEWMPSDLGWALHDDGDFRFTSGPDVIASGGNFRDVYVRGTDGVVYHKFWLGDTWSEWFSLGGNIQGSPAVTKPSPGTVDIYVRGPDDRLYQKWWTGKEWMPSDLGWAMHDDGDFRLGSAPSVVTIGPDFRDVYVRGSDGEVYHKFWDGLNWSDWFRLGGKITGAPCVVLAPGGLPDIYVRGEDDRLYQKWWTGNGWMPSELGWIVHDDGFLLGSTPAVVVNVPNVRDVYVRGQDGAVYHKIFS